MKFKHYFILFVALFFVAGCVSSQKATIKEAEEVITTYPFSGPDPVPILIRSSLWGKGARLYPYTFFDEFSTEPEEKTWKVVHMENPYVSVDVLPEVGGKVWGAVDKETGLEFIYKNHVLKFREIALRGPWTSGGISGGIEFNFGIVGHTPSGAHPVNYVTRKNPDGSVSCIIGAMDLPSRTFWRIDIKVPEKGAYFETNSFWLKPEMTSSMFSLEIITSLIIIQSRLSPGLLTAQGETCPGIKTMTSGVPKAISQWVNTKNTSEDTGMMMPSDSGTGPFMMICRDTRCGSGLCPVRE